MGYSDMDRLGDALEGEPRDRLPILPMNALWVASNFPGHSFSEVASQIWAKEPIGYDWLDPHADPLYIPEAFGCKVRFLKTGPLIEPLPIPLTSLEDVESFVSASAESRTLRASAVTWRLRSPNWALSSFMRGCWGPSVAES